MGFFFILKYNLIISVLIKYSCFIWNIFLVNNFTHRCKSVAYFQGNIIFFALHSNLHKYEIFILCLYDGFIFKEKLWKNRRAIIADFVVNYSSRQWKKFLLTWYKNSHLILFTSSHPSKPTAFGSLPKSVWNEGMGMMWQKYFIDGCCVIYISSDSFLRYFCLYNIKRTLYFTHFKVIC